MTHYIFNTPDGTVWVYEHLGGDLEEALAKFAQTSGEPQNVAPVDPKTLPPKDDYRGAWKLEGGNVAYDIEKAKALHVERIRAAREPLLKALDVDYIRAVETGADTKAIAAEKQRLRDAPANKVITDAKTVDDLRKAWPL